MIARPRLSWMLSIFLCVGSGAWAQPAKQVSAQVPEPNGEAEKAGPASLNIYFSSGSSVLRPEDKAVLDKASRTYNEGRPIVMILTGTSDSSGNPAVNLLLSQKRATAVLNGLLGRGIPANRFQIVAKGETELPVPTSRGISEAKNRRVEITWR